MLRQRTRTGAASHTHLSRRSLLRASIAGAVASAVGGGLPFALPSPANALAVSSPDEALKLLVDGNQRFADRKLTFYQQDLGWLQQSTLAKQTPFASVLSCADSRVPVEIIFDQSIGQIFVNRVAGNLATTEIIASINMASRCSAPRSSWCWATATAALCTRQSTARRCRGRSARFIASSARP